MVVKTNEKEAEINIGAYKLGNIGIEILDLLKVSANFNYLESIGQVILNREIFTVEIAAIKERVSQGVMRYETIRNVAREPQ